MEATSEEESEVAAISEPVLYEQYGRDEVSDLFEFEGAPRTLCDGQWINFPKGNGG